MEENKMKTRIQVIELVFDTFEEGEFKSIEEVTTTLRKYEKIAFTECRKLLKKGKKSYENLRVDNIAFSGIEDFPLILFDFYYETNQTIYEGEY